MSKQQKIEPGRLYRVTLRKSVRVGRIVLTPGGNTKLRGDALAALIEMDSDAVAHYEAS